MPICRVSRHPYRTRAFAFVPTTKIPWRISKWSPIPSISADKPQFFTDSLLPDFIKSEDSYTSQAKVQSPSASHLPRRCPQLRPNCIPNKGIFYTPLTHDSTYSEDGWHDDRLATRKYTYEYDFWTRDAWFLFRSLTVDGNDLMLFVKGEEDVGSRFVSRRARSEDVEFK